MTQRDDLSPRLIWTDDGAPRSGRFGDVYFSREDGLAESRAVFLQGCGLPEAWAGRRRFVVAELGFGTGLNIAALLHLWPRSRPTDGRLSIFSFEGFPLTRDEAARALSAWPELADETRALLDAWPNGAPGFHRMDLTDSVTLDLAIGDAAWALEQWTGAADAWFLDGFAPSTNPDMWSEAVLEAIRIRSAPGARLATFTVAGAVRRGLSERGFQIDKRPGHGRKRERLEGRAPGAPLNKTTPRVAIVGAGIAGAALARAFDALGAAATLVSLGKAGDGGSGFPAALVTPRLDAGDEGIATLYAQALRRASRLYDQLPDAVTGRGVLQLEQAPRDAARFDKVVAQDHWAEGEMRRLTAEEASDRLGEPVGAGALLMANARAIRPTAVLEPWLADSECIEARIERLDRAGAGWRLIGAAGLLLEADMVILANAMDAARLWPNLPLSPVAGQAEWVEGPPPPPVAWGGYVAPGRGGWLFGATHDRGVVDPVPSDAASANNFETLAARLPRLARRAEPSRSRAAVRATTPDRLPLAGRLAEGLFALTGLGSRGFCAAPLLAEHVAAAALGTPSPLPAALAERVSPDRFTTLRNRER